MCVCACVRMCVRICGCVCVRAVVAVAVVVVVVCVCVQTIGNWEPRMSTSTLHTPPEHCNRTKHVV